MRSEVAPDQRSTERVQCLPLYSLILAMGNPKYELQYYCCICQYSMLLYVMNVFPAEASVLYSCMINA